MRRPINWFVVCLSLLFLYANLSFEGRPAPPLEQGAPLTSADLEFAHVIVAELAPPQFGYVRDDGSFIPLAQQPATQPAAATETADF